MPKFFSAATGFAVGSGALRAANRGFDERREALAASDLEKVKRARIFAKEFAATKATTLAENTKKANEREARRLAGVSGPGELALTGKLLTPQELFKQRQTRDPAVNDELAGIEFTAGKAPQQSLFEAGAEQGVAAEDFKAAGISDITGREGTLPSINIPPGFDFNKTFPRSLQGSQTALINAAITGDKEKFFSSQSKLDQFNQALAAGNPALAMTFISPQRAVVDTTGDTSELQDAYFKIIKDIQNPKLKGQALEALRANKFSEVARLIGQDGEESGLEIEGAPFAVFLKNPVAVGNIIIPRGQTTASRSTRGTIIITVNTPKGIVQKELPSVSVIPFSAQSPEAPGPTAAQTADFALEVEQQNRGAEIADQLAQMVDTGQLPGGVAGAIKGFAQTAVGSIRDIADLLKGDAPLTGLLVAQESTEAPSEILENDDPRFKQASEKIKSDLNDLFAFNPEIPRAEVRASYIALLLAFSRFPRGRINVSIINQTALLTGVFRGSRADVVARLTEVAKELRSRATFTGKQLQRSVPLESITVPSIKLKDSNGKVINVTSDDVIETANTTGKSIEQVLKDLKNPEFLKTQGLIIVQ